MKALHANARGKVGNAEGIIASRTTTLRILEVIEAVCREESAEVTRLSADLGIPQPTAYKHVESLVEAGFLARGPRGRITSGPRLRTMLYDSLQNEPAVALRRAILTNLMNALEETVSLSVPDGLDLYYFDRIECNWPINYRLSIGDKLPIRDCASGLLFLGTFDPAQALEIIRYQAPDKKKLTRKWEATFLSELEQIHAQGYALDDEMFLQGMNGAAVPIYDSNGVQKAYLSSHGLKIRRDMEKVKADIPLMQEAARKLSDLFFRDAGSGPKRKKKAVD